MPDVVLHILATKRVNEFLHSAYTVEQIAEWEPLMLDMVTASQEVLAFVQGQAKGRSWAEIDRLLK